MAQHDGSASKSIDSTQVETVHLSDGRELVVRHATAADLAQIQALYERLSTSDQNRRFFHAHPPRDAATLQWVTVGDHGGVCLVAEVVEHGDSLVVAEAGYALLDTGDGELAITVDADWRGWMGPWLLDILTQQAAQRGVANLEADVLVANRTMRAMLEHRGYAAVDHPDWNQVRLVISTAGHTPGWPDTGDKPHLWAVSSAARWAGESEAQAAGFEVRTCPGPAALHGCPVLEGQPCPLLESADVVVFDLPRSAQQETALAEVLSSKTVPVVYTRGQAGGSRCERVADIVDQLSDAVSHQADSER